MEELRPGKYIGSIIDYKVSTTKDEQHALIMLRFQFGDSHTLWWSRPLNSDKMMEIIAKTLTTCGYVYPDLSYLYDNTTSAFPTDKKLEIVVENSEYNGKTRTQISFINELGGMSFKKLSAEDGKKLTAQFNISGALAANRASAVKKDPEIPF